MFLIDTCTQYAYFADVEQVVQHWKSEEPGSIFTCETVILEVIDRRIKIIDDINAGKKDSRGTITDAYRRLIDTIDDMRLLPLATYDQIAENHFTRLSGKRVKANVNDCRIASTALANNLIVVTSNVRHFSMYLPTSKIQDWTRPDRGIGA